MGMVQLIPNDGGMEDLLERKGPEIHSAKWHRCVDKVSARGGGYNAYAVCTSSIGKAGTFAKGHGGSASPKRRRSREADVELLAACAACEEQDEAKCKKCRARMHEATMDAAVDALVREGEKWHRCINKVKQKGSGKNAYAICTKSVGREH